MKKVLLLMISLVLSLLVLIGCGGADTGNKGDDSDKNDRTEETQTSGVSLILANTKEKNKRKQTKIEFVDEKKCFVRINFDGETVTENCSYTVYETSDERWLVEVNASNLALKLKDEKMVSTFYLGEQDDGSWKYYGSSIGDSLYGVTYVYENDEEPDFKIKKVLPDVEISEKEYEQNEEKGGIIIFTPEKVDRQVFEVTCSYTEYYDWGGEDVFTETTISEIDAVYGNYVFLKEPFDIPRMIERSRFKSEIVDNMPDGRQKDMFLSFFLLKSLSDPTLTNLGKQKLYEKYPIVKKYEILTLDTPGGLEYFKFLEDYIKETCPEYDYEEMLKDYLTVEYKQVCGVLEYSDDGSVSMRYFNHSSDKIDLKTREYKAK